MFSPFFQIQHQGNGVVQCTHADNWLRSSDVTHYSNRFYSSVVHGGRGVSLLCTVPTIRNKYSQKWNCAASFPISTFTSMYLWAIIIFPRSVRLFCCIAFAVRAREYINRSQILVHEYGNWERGRAVSFLGIFVSNLWYSAFFQCVNGW